jgi:hypothetical protein
MKPILQKILAILGIKRKKPQTKVGRIARRCEHFVSVTLLLYLGVMFYPQPLFGHQLEHEGITLYSTEPIPAERSKALLSQIRSKIRFSELHSENQVFQIFLCNSKPLYAFFAPLSRRSFGQTNLLGNIIIANTNLDTNIATAFRSEHNERSFVGVATHEIGHEMIKDKLGLLSAYRAPKWLNEGYCEYISGESSFPERQGIEIISQGKSEKSSSFKYFEYRKMVDFCLNERGTSIKELFLDPPSEQDVRSQTRQWLSR